jgi:predicted kinase
MNKETFKNITFEEIYLIHKRNLKYLEVRNERRTALCFSGVPGAGKTTISKQLEKELKAIRIEIDEIRDIVSKIFEQKNLEFRDNEDKYLKIKNQSYKYLEQLLKYLHKNKKNSLIILDFSLDRRYFYVQSLLDNLNYKIFSISIEADEEQLRERIKTRDSGMLDHSIYLKMLPNWINDHSVFNSQHKLDIYINTNKLTIEESTSEILQQFRAIK